MKSLQLMTAGLLALGVFSSSAYALDQTYAKPKQGGMRVDWCYSWGAQCGKPAADRFCQSKGYVQSNDYVEDVDIGASGIDTLVQGTGQVCHGSFCDGFTYVTCEKPDAGPPPPPPGPPPPGPGPGSGDTHTYKKPKIGGARLNMCFKKNVDCDGQTAADAYCEAKGWDDAADFNESQPFTPLIPTR